MNEPANEFEVSESGPSPLAIVGRWCVALIVATAVSYFLADILSGYGERLMQKVQFATWLSTIMTLINAWNLRGWKDVVRLFVEWAVFAVGLVIVSIGLDWLLGY